MKQLNREQREQIRLLLQECSWRSIEDLGMEKDCKDCNRLPICKSIYKDLELWDINEYKVSKYIKGD